MSCDCHMISWNPRGLELPNTSVVLMKSARTYPILQCTVAEPAELILHVHSMYLGSLRCVNSNLVYKFSSNTFQFPIWKIIEP